MDQEGLPPLQEREKILPPNNYICKLCNSPGHYMKQCEQYLSSEEYVAAEPTTKKPKKEVTEKKETKREAPYRPIPDDVWDHLCSFYGMDVKSDLRSRLWCRSDGASAVNYVDESISHACFGPENALEIVNTGLKVFTKQVERTITYYRPTEEASGFITTFFIKRLIDLAKEDFVVILQNLNKHTPFTALHPNAQAELETLEQGPIVIRLDTNPLIELNAWIGTRALLPRISKLKKIEFDHALGLGMD